MSSKFRPAVALLFAVALSGCAGSEAPSTPPTIDTTRAATTFAEGATDADLVVFVEVTTRVNDRLPHHMAQAQLAFINRTQRDIELPPMGPEALRIVGSDGQLAGKAAARSRSARVTLAPGQMLVSNVDLLKAYDFPTDGGRFSVRFAEDPRLGGALRLRTNADYFVVGPR
ncbi:MAG: hypothetical protein AAF721_25535 [Myxococcota bacterium]